MDTPDTRHPQFAPRSSRTDRLLSKWLSTISESSVISGRAAIPVWRWASNREGGNNRQPDQEAPKLKSVRSQDTSEISTVPHILVVMRGVWHLDEPVGGLRCAEVTLAPANIRMAGEKYPDVESQRFSILEPELVKEEGRIIYLDLFFHYRSFACGFNRVSMVANIFVSHFHFMKMVVNGATPVPQPRTRYS